MSPEQARGNPRFDHRADLYSVAAMLYECIAGQVPHVRANYHALLLAIVEGKPAPLESTVAILPRGLSEVVHRGLAVNPDQRYADADEFARALMPYLTLTRKSGSTPAPAIRRSRDSGVTVARDPRPTSEPLVSQTVSMGAMRYLQGEYGPAAVAELLTRLPSAHATLLIEGSANLRCPASVCDALLNEAEIEFGAGAMSLSRAIGVEIANSAAARTLRWVRGLTTQELLARLPDVWSDLFDFGRLSVLPVGPTRCRIDVSDAHPESPARDAMMAGVFSRLITITGARSVDVYAANGIDRGATIYRAGWTP